MNANAKRQGNGGFITAEVGSLGDSFFDSRQLAWFAGSRSVAAEPRRAIHGSSVRAF